MGKLRYSITYEVDKDLLCDEETLRTEFDNSWQKWIEWFADQELGEVLTGLGEEPVLIKVED